MLRGLLKVNSTLATLEWERLARTTVAGLAAVVLFTMNREKFEELTLLVRKPITVIGKFFEALGFLKKSIAEKKESRVLMAYEIP